MLLKKHKKGFSLLEIILVLAIAAAIIVSAFIIYPKVQYYNRVNQEVKNLSALSAGINSLYVGQPYYTGVSNLTIINAGLVPDNMLLPMSYGYGTGHIFNSWKGEVILSTSNKQGATVVGTLYNITSYNIPNEDCIKLVSFTAPNYYWIIVNGTTVVGPSTKFDISNASSACSKDNKNYISFSGT